MSGLVSHDAHGAASVVTDGPHSAFSRLKGLPINTAPIVRQHYRRAACASALKTKSLGVFQRAADDLIVGCWRWASC